MVFIVLIVAIKLYIKLYEFVGKNISREVSYSKHPFLLKLVYKTACVAFIVINVKLFIFIKSNIILSIASYLLPGWGLIPTIFLILTTWMAASNLFS